MPSENTKERLAPTEQGQIITLNFDKSAQIIEILKVVPLLKK